MRYSEFIGKPKFKTGSQGICYDFNDGVRIWLPKGNFHIKCTDLDTFTTIAEQDFHINNGDGSLVILRDYQCYRHWYVEIQQEGKASYRFECDLKDKNVVLNLSNDNIVALGDSIAAMVMAEKFRHKYQCNVFVVLPKTLLTLFKRAYPNINFIADVQNNRQVTYQQLPKNIYATYNISNYNDQTNEIQKTDFWMLLDVRQEGLLRYFAGRLGLFECDVIQQPSHFFSPNCEKSRIWDPYVCISGKGSDYQKEWANANGWAETVRYLKQLGYRVLCIDGDGIEKDSPLDKALAEGLEDFTGYKPLQERVDLLYYADFFIGISSGLSWLAWGTGKPVVLISGYTLPIIEFYTPYRIINYNVCHGCYNNLAFWKITGPDIYHSFPCKYTERYLECSHKIDARAVCRNIDKLMQDYHLTVPKDRQGK